LKLFKIYKSLARLQLGVLFFLLCPSLSYLLQYLSIKVAFLDFIGQLFLKVFNVGIKTTYFVLQLHHLIVFLFLHEALHHFWGRHTQKRVSLARFRHLAVHDRFLELFNHLSSIFHLILLQFVNFFQTIAHTETKADASQCKLSEMLMSHGKWLTLHGSLKVDKTTIQIFKLYVALVLLPIHLGPKSVHVRLDPTQTPIKSLKFTLFYLNHICGLTEGVVCHF
jgi:hypothetical protein